MYALKPVFELDSVVDIPSCMYSLPVIQCSAHIPGVGGHGHGGVAAAAGQAADLKALEARQDAIIARLERLKADVESYKQSIGLAVSSGSVSSAQVWSTTNLSLFNADISCLQLTFPCIVASDSTLTRIDKLKESIKIIEAIFKEGPVRSVNSSKVVSPHSSLVCTSLLNPCFPCFVTPCLNIYM